jgi:membrane protease YdiL (CAAX protease family)
MSGVRGLFWNGTEARLRAPWRVGATLSLLLLAAVVVAPLARLLTGLDAPGSGWDLVVLAGAFLGLSVAVVGLSWVVDRRYTRDLGVALSGRWYRDCAAGLAVGGAMATAVVAALLATGTASVTGTVTGREAQLTVTGVGPLASAGLWALFYAGAATLEEVAVRGYLLVNAAEGLSGRLGRRRGVLAAAAVTAGLFGILHASNPGGTILGLLNVTLAGVLLGGAYVLTGRLAMAVGIHAAWNFAVGAVYGLPVSGLETSSALLAVEPDGPRVLTGGAFGPEGGVLMLAALAVGAALVLLWVRRSEGALFLQTHIAEPDLRKRPVVQRADGANEGDGPDADADGQPDGDAAGETDTGTAGDGGDGDRRQPEPEG